MKEVSENQKKLNRLKHSVGDETFRQLMQQFSGESIYFSPSGEIIDRNKEIQSLYDEEMSIPAICSKFCLSQSRVYDILKIRKD